MVFLLWAMGLIGAGGILALACSRRPEWAGRMAAGTVTVGAGLGLVPVLKVLAGGYPLTLQIAWNLIPGAGLSLYLDGLAGLFLAPILVLSALSAIYGVGYLAHGGDQKRSGSSWFFYNTLVASMVTVVLAHNAILFLVAWEVMAVASFFLVVSDDEREEVRQAGWTYLVATHLGTAFLFVFFLLVGGPGSLDFTDLASAGGKGELFRSVMFLLALAGFGTKAGLIPLHVWLPEAHPAAPSHVSALMSGVMIKTGIYGILRALSFLGMPLAWWGWVLIGVGALSGILGVLLALGQQDLKRMLAYSTVENVGIILLGLGLGVLGISNGHEMLAVLGFGGALVHVINHALFKGLLFLGAGSVLYATHTRNLEQMGGLLKRMPWTGATFLLGATAIAGLPPLNGFIGEFLLYLGGFTAMSSAPAALAVPAAGVLVALALIGGLAAVCFTRAAGIGFLGEARSEAARHAQEIGWSMRLPMVILAAGCVGVGLTAPWLVTYLTPGLAVVTGGAVARVQENQAEFSGILWGVEYAAGGFLIVLGLLILLRRVLLSRQTVGASGTWDCGYAAPTARMQYTASSFAQPLTELFQAALWTQAKAEAPVGLFPARASFFSQTPEIFREYVYGPLFRGVRWFMAQLRWLQHGRVQVYVLYIAITLLVLLIWKLG